MMAVPRERRSRRARGVRGRTISTKRMPQRDLDLGRLLYPESLTSERPTKRSQCVEVGRPCPYVGCKHHLYLDINPRTGSIKLNFPDLQPEEMGECCALDIAGRGGHPLEVVAVLTNLSTERVRQIEVAALRKLAAAPGALAEFADEPGRVSVRAIDEES